MSLQHILEKQRENLDIKLTLGGKVIDFEGNLRPDASKELKSFISTIQNELIQAFKEKVEASEVEKAIGHPAKFNFADEWYAGYNTALSTLLSWLEGEKK